MVLETDLEERIKDLIAKRLGENLDAQISVKSIEVSDAESEIRIVVEISTAESPDIIAQRYFGLTGKVRDALGEKWRSYFPVITPNIGSEVHA